MRSRAWVEIDLTALRTNYRTIRERVGSRVGIIPMVKAGCYGLRSPAVIDVFEAEGPWGYGVATVAEGIELREGFDGRRPPVRRPILVVTPIPPGGEQDAAEAQLTACISDLDGLDRWSAAARRQRTTLDFHVEVDTGMGRAGFDWREVQSWATAVRERVGPQLRWTGVFTHFHSADAADGTSVEVQWERFQDTLSRLPVSREDLVVHAANSAAAMRWPEVHADAVRPGIFLYGGHPAPDIEDAAAIAPKPVVAVRARLAMIRDVPPGTTVGYGATHTARSWERWGTLDIGYGDGLPRSLGNRGSAIVRGRRVPIIGRISMDLTVVDLSGVPEAAPGDIVTLIGSDGGEEITVDEVAGQAQTISYEILTGLTPRLPRVLLDGGAPDSETR